MHTTAELDSVKVSRKSNNFVTFPVLRGAKILIAIRSVWGASANLHSEIYNVHYSQRITNMNTKRSESRDLPRRPDYQRGMRFAQLMMIAAIRLLLLFLTVKARAQSALDSFDPNASGAVRIAVV